MNPRRILRRARRRGYLALTRQVFERLFKRSSRHFPLSARKRALCKRWRCDCARAGKVTIVAMESPDGTWDVITSHPDGEIKRAAYKVATRLPVTTLDDVRRVVRDLQDLDEVRKLACVIEVDEL